MKYLVRNFFLVVVFHFISIGGCAQNKKVTNIFFRTIGNTMEIFYDLLKNTDTLNVKVYFRKKSDPKLKYRLKWVSGSIGIGRFSGRKQKVVWNYKKEPSYLFTGSGFYYEVIARKISHRTKNFAVGGVLHLCPARSPPLSACLQQVSQQTA